jgi:hypothetical protein
MFTLYYDVDYRISVRVHEEDSTGTRRMWSDPTTRKRRDGTASAQQQA